jgi:hypothetical protein
VLFELSNYDNIKLSSSVISEEIIAANDDECAMACLQRNFCDHFVFIRSIPPLKSSKKKNCYLAVNTNENIFPCRFDSVCAFLSPCNYQKQQKAENQTLLTIIKFLTNCHFKSKITYKTIR